MPGVPSYDQGERQLLASLEHELGVLWDSQLYVLLPRRREDYTKVSNEAFLVDWQMYTNILIFAQIYDIMIKETF